MRRLQAANEAAASKGGQDPRIEQVYGLDSPGVIGWSWMVDDICGVAVTWTGRNASDRSAALGSVPCSRWQRERPCKANRRGSMPGDHPLDRDGLAEPCRGGRQRRLDHGPYCEGDASILANDAV